MADFAIVENGTVVNVIVAEDRATAIAVTGLEVVAITDGVPGMGWALHAGAWRPPSPFSSWEWNGNVWEAPIPYPADGASYVWDEGQRNWVEFVPSVVEDSTQG